MAVIAMGGQADLRASLTALAEQQGAPALEVVVTFDPALPGIPALAPEFPNVRFVENTGQKSPLELASRAIRNTSGARVLVTKDYCRPGPGWARALLAELDGPCAAAGGTVRLPDDASATEWAFSYLDFFPFTGPTDDGATDRLTVCSAAYRRADLDAIDDVWREHFQESAVNAALVAHTGGQLVLNPRGEVTLVRRVDLQEALQERYRLGRIFAAERAALGTPATRWALRLGAPALPPLMLSRMTKKAAQDPKLARRFAAGLPPLVSMVLARTWGEWLGYLTGRPPESSSR